jgi:hypothetical protein
MARIGKGFYISLFTTIIADWGKHIILWSSRR